MNFLSQLIHWLRYVALYHQSPRWDKGVSPPELMAFIDQHQPGNALDMGCGTGTNLVTLARHGWEVVGIDFVPKAVRSARRKVKEENLKGKLILGDVLKTQPIAKDFDLVLDIGCFHSQAPQKRSLYLNNVNNYLKPGGFYLLYAHTAFDDQADHGILRDDLDLLSNLFELQALHETKERHEGQSSLSRPSLWGLYLKPNN